MSGEDNITKHDTIDATSIFSPGQGYFRDANIISWQSEAKAINKHAVINENLVLPVIPKKRNVLGYGSM